MFPLEREKAGPYDPSANSSKTVYYNTKHENGEYLKKQKAFFKADSHISGIQFSASTRLLVDKAKISIDALVKGIF